MFLSCPNCQTEYDVPNAALTGRPRTLRCSNCTTKWQVPALAIYREEPVPVQPEPEPVEPELERPAAAEPFIARGEDGETLAREAVEPVTTTDAAMAAEAAKPEDAPEPERVRILKESRNIPAAAEPKPQPKRGLGISVLLVVVIVVGVLVLHRQIGVFWPPSLRLFNALGLR